MEAPAEGVWKPVFPVGPPGGMPVPGWRLTLEGGWEEEEELLLPPAGVRVG